MLRLWKSCCQIGTLITQNSALGVGIALHFGCCIFGLLSPPFQFLTLLSSSFHSLFW